MRERARTHGLTVTIVAACLVGAVIAFLLALDVAATSAALRDDDVRYQALPDERLWSPAQRVPAGSPRRSRGRGRRALPPRAPGDAPQPSGEPGFSDPSYVVNRNDATAWLTDIVEHDSSAERRSAAANLLGVLSFSDAIADYTNRGRLLASSAGRFRQAIALDPGNDEAKLNLELTLSRSKGLDIAESGGGTNPSPGGKGARGAGAGEGGSGY